MSAEPAVHAPAARRVRSAGELVRAVAITVGVFTSGGVLLAVEIAASRVLAPSFGNSLYVWGALIGVVLTGLAIGYWAGGALADRFPTTELLLSVMTLGALLVLTVPLVDGRVLDWIVGWDPGPRLDPLLAAAILFGPLSVVLASVTPVAVRLAALSLATVGRIAGRLFAVSTAGSIVGTFATAFFLLPELGTGQLLSGAAATLLAAVALVALTGRAYVAGALGLAAAAGAVVVTVALAPDSEGRLTGRAAQNYSPLYRLRGGAAGDVDYRAEGYRVRFREETAYHALAVVEDSEARYLRFDSSFQSAMPLRRPFGTSFAYTDWLQLALAYNPSARDVLFIGLGGGSAPKRVWRDFPHVQIDAVELDPVVRDVAQRWFGLPRDERLRVTVDDGRRFLRRTDRRWDAIVIDAYYSDSVPFHLTTREFLELVRTRLRPGGVVAANVIGAVRGRESRLFRSFWRTYGTVFPTLAVHPVGSGPPEELRNLVVVATESALPQRDFLVSRWRGIRARSRGAPDLTRAIRARYERQIPTDDVPLLTDDFAPTDALILID